MTGNGAQAGGPPVACARCGRPPAAGGPGLDWASEKTPGRGTRYLCPQCVRQALRGIEARLDGEDW